MGAKGLPLFLKQAYDLIGPAQHQHNTTSASPNYQPEPSDWTGLQPLSDAGGSQRFRPPSPSNQAAQVPAGSSMYPSNQRIQSQR